jgi:hypothetical protein
MKEWKEVKILCCPATVMGTKAIKATVISPETSA